MATITTEAETRVAESETDPESPRYRADLDNTTQIREEDSESQDSDSPVIDRTPNLRPSNDRLAGELLSEQEIQT